MNLALLATGKIGQPQSIVEHFDAIDSKVTSPTIKRTVRLYPNCVAVNLNTTTKSSSKDYRRVLIMPIS
jgi:hypothetical protein